MLKLIDFIVGTLTLDNKKFRAFALNFRIFFSHKLRVCANTTMNCRIFLSHSYVTYKSYCSFFVFIKIDHNPIWLELVRFSFSSAVISFTHMLYQSKSMTHHRISQSNFQDLVSMYDNNNVNIWNANARHSYVCLMRYLHGFAQTNRQFSKNNKFWLQPAWLQSNFTTHKHFSKMNKEKGV